MKRLGLLAIEHFVNGHDPHIDRISSKDQLIVNNIFNYVGTLNLPEVQFCITQSDICCVILVRIFEVLLAFHIISGDFGKQVCIHQVIDIQLDSMI